MLTERVEVTLQPTELAIHAQQIHAARLALASHGHMCEGGCVLLADICSVRTRVITHRVSSDHQDDDNDDDVRPTRPSSGQTLTRIAMVNSMGNARRVDRVRKHL